MFLCSFLRESLFGLKREVLCKFPQKYFKTTEKHSLSVCGSLWREKQFWLILSPFNGFVRNSCLTNPNFSQVLPLFKHVKENKLSEFLVFLSEIVTFWTKKRSSLWISPKMFKNNRKASVCGSHWEQKQFLLIFVPFLQIWSKTVV